MSFALDMEVGFIWWLVTVLVFGTYAVFSLALHYHRGVQIKRLTPTAPAKKKVTRKRTAKKKPAAPATRPPAAIALPAASGGSFEEQLRKASQDG